MATIVYGDFEWDEAKAASNFEKHGVSFEEAATALVDPKALFLADDSIGEEPLVAIGMSKQTRIVFVVHVARGERDRIISARIATNAEESFYEQSN